jgi:ectoine hydroxylase-related dioxygenase (phytanoyl-CoA dioxygenase family)
MENGETMSEKMPDAPLDDAEAARLAAGVEERGYVVAENLIPDALRESLIERIDRALHDHEIPFGANAFLGSHTRRIFNLLAHDRLFETPPVFARTLPVIEQVLDDECLLSSLTAIEMNPGQKRQPIHSDDGSYGFARPSPTYIVVAMWALTDFNEENGGTHVVPGSHRQDRRPRRGEDPETIQIEMPAGSVLFYSGSLWHGGGENRSDERRMGIVNNYCAGFLRQEESQLLALSRERVVDFEPRLRRLVGYGTYRGLLGHVNQQNPEVLVASDAETDMVWGRFGR